MTPPSNCAWCGSTEWTEDGPRLVCATCDLTPMQAALMAERAAKAEVAKRATNEKHAERRRELDRRAWMVIEATKGQPMLERIAVAKYLLLACHGLTAEAWNAEFKAWQKALHAVERAS